MINCNVVISKESPSVRNALWLKPIEGGFAAYAKFNGKWQPLQLADDGGTATVGDDQPSQVSTALDKVKSITTIKSSILNRLKVGDSIIKVTGKQEHLYTVTYKGKGVGEGICLTYQAAGLIETVSYDYTDDGWVYNSTDKCTLTVDS